MLLWPFNYNAWNAGAGGKWSPLTYDCIASFPVAGTCGHQLTWMAAFIEAQLSPAKGGWLWLPWVGFILLLLRESPFSSLWGFTPTPPPHRGTQMSAEPVEIREVSYQLWFNEEYHCQILQNGISSDAEGRRLHRNYRGKFDSFFNPVIKAFAVQSRWNNNVILALNAHLFLSVSINKMVGGRKADLLSPIH